MKIQVRNAERAVRSVIRRVQKIGDCTSRLGLAQAYLYRDSAPLKLHGIGVDKAIARGSNCHAYEEHDQKGACTLPK